MCITKKEIWKYQDPTLQPVRDRGALEKRHVSVFRANLREYPALDYSIHPATLSYARRKEENLLVPEPESLSESDHIHPQSHLCISFSTM
jgi:hypothetical protein